MTLGDNDVLDESRALAELLLKRDSISDELAARLAFRIAQDVLYLKSQIPLPVHQLAKVPENSKIPPKTEKKRRALLETLDLLSSHLITTFTVLSRAIYLSQVDSKIDVTPSTRVHLLYSLGPSTSMPKARFLLELSHMEPVALPPSLELDDDDDDDSSGSSVEESDDELGENTDSDEPPPPSPSPTPSIASRPSSPSLSGPSHPNECRLHPGTSSPRPSAEKSSHVDCPPSLTEAPQSLAALHERQLRHSEQLLSRTLSCSEELRSITNELPPTQMFLMLRAPRIFQHPAWRPLQAQSPQLDKQVNEFLNPPPIPAGKKKPSLLKSRTTVEGIRVLCAESGEECNAAPLSEPHDGMIWWVWTEKVIGFSDW